MAKAKKLPSGSWRVQIPSGEKDMNGKYKYRSITAPTQKEAELMALEYELKSKEISQSSANMTLYEAMVKYIDIKSNVLSPTTVRLYTQIRNSYLKSIMNTKLNRLNIGLIQSAINDETRSHSPKTVRNIYGLLTAVLKLYNRPLFYQLDIMLPQKQKRDMRILTPEQLVTLLNAVEGKTIEIPILLAAWLGLRQSEICGIQWDSIDFKNSILTIKQAKVMGKDNKYVLKTTKTVSSQRKIQIPVYIMDKIKQLPRTDDFVINIKAKSIYDGLKYALRKNNLPDTRFHDLRHFNASVMIALNVPDKYAMERGGWATDYVYKNVYQHTFSDERKAVDTSVNNYFLELLKK